MIRIRTWLSARLRHDDRGSISLLITGFVVVILMVTALGAAITSVHLDRTALQSTADTAALAASQEIASPMFYGKPVPLVQTEQARQAAENHVQRYAERRGSMERVRVTDVQVSADGTVTVRLSATSHPVLVGWITRGTGTPIPLTVEASSRAQ